MSTTATGARVATPGVPDADRDAGRAATDPAGPTGRLATWLAATTLDDVPAAVQEEVVAKVRGTAR